MWQLWPNTGESLAEIKITNIIKILMLFVILIFQSSRQLSKVISVGFIIKGVSVNVIYTA